MKELNYMSGELKLMDKKSVEDAYYNLCKATGKKVLRADLRKIKKEQIIREYINLRNKKLIWG